MIVEPSAHPVNRQPITPSDLVRLIRAMNALESVTPRGLTTLLSNLTYAELNGLYDHLEETRHQLEQITETIEKEIGERQWNGEARA
jgi:ferritin-like metal-binding protein YciE